MTVRLLRYGRSSKEGRAEEVGEENGFDKNPNF